MANGIPEENSLKKEMPILASSQMFLSTMAGKVWQSTEILVTEETEKSMARGGGVGRKERKQEEEMPMLASVFLLHLYSITLLSLTPRSERAPWPS